MCWIVVAVVIVLTACSGDDHDVIVDGVVEIPASVSLAMPPNSPVARNDYPDFDGDGTNDFVLSYGPIENNANTEKGVLVDVNGVATRFTRSDAELDYSVEDVTGEGVADLTVTWVEESLTCRYSFQGGLWVAIDGVALCEDAATDV